MMEAVACIIAGGQEAKTKMRLIQTAAVVLLMVSALSAAKTLDMYVVDVEGGKSLLLVSPSGQSMVVDTGGGREVASRKSTIWWCRTTMATTWAASRRWRRACPS